MPNINIRWALCLTAEARRSLRAPSARARSDGASVILDVTSNYTRGALVGLWLRREVSGCFLGLDLHQRILRHEIGRQRDPLANLDSSGDEGVVFQIRHRHEA